MSIERFDCNSEMYHSNHGSFVRYDDHAAELAAERTKVERLRGALIGACERMERARNILQTPNSNWAMLDTATLRAALEAER